MPDNSNTQTAPVANPPAAAEPTSAELQAKIAELEKQSEGRLRDLQSERAKRQELESKVNPPAPSTEPVSDGAQDEVGKVINPYVEARVKPLLQRLQIAESFAQQSVLEKTAEFLAAKTGKSKDSVMTDRDLTDKLVDVAKRFGLNGGVYDVTKKAYEIMELENLRASEAERRRAAEAAGSSSLPTGTQAPKVVTGKEFSEEEFNSMPLFEYEKLQNEGSFVMDEISRKITYKPQAK